ncbi:MAG: sulfite exporter TauE/SafE family protein [Tannerella sp.]|nr:sulfite exporter TauE/SafE family protein [Tannerella sp.]
MTDFLNLYPLTAWEWCVVIACGLLIGMSKTGINGLGMVYVPILAMIFGAKPSTGILLPMLCLADLFAVAYYRRSAAWKYIIRLIPWSLVGFGMALFVDHLIPDKGFKTLIGICIFAGIGVMAWNEYRGKGTDVPTAWWFAALFGILGGFTTMIGNAAGPIMSVFLLSVRLPKTSFVGTAAWFFMIINYLKLPLQYFVWHNISVNTLIFDVTMLPVIAVGAWLGIIFVKRVSEKIFRIIIYSLTLLSAILLFL